MDSEAPGRQLPCRAPAPRGQLRRCIRAGSAPGRRPSPCLRAVPSARAGRPSADRPHTDRDPRSRRATARRDHRRQGHRLRRARTADGRLPRDRSRSPRRRASRPSPVACGGGRLRAAGCRAEPPVPKVIRVLGPRASGPPDVIVPYIGADATVDMLLRYATARSVAQILRHDPGVRLGEDPEEVHQFRVATRRLRSDLRTFAPRIRAKRCRYAAEAVAPVFGHQVGRFAAAIAAVQAILGDHQDTVVAEAWLRATGAALSPACVSAGELIAAERTERARLRSGWPNVWKRATARKLRRWL
jgi:hypothetical protein